jgi:hypothetical protein
LALQRYEKSHSCDHEWDDLREFSKSLVMLQEVAYLESASIGNVRIDHAIRCVITQSVPVVPVVPVPIKAFLM